MLEAMKKLALLAIILILASTKLVWADEKFDNVVHVEDEEMKILIGLNKTYKPGEAIRVDFFITNKQSRVVSEIDIRLDVYYLGKKVFTYSHPSWREYTKGREVHIYYETNLPAITLPGTYTLKFYFSPEGQKPKSGETVIEVVPTESWYATVALIFLAFFTLALIITVHRERIGEFYFNLSIGQRFVLLAIIFLIGAALLLAGGAESFANNLAVITYFCLVVGVANLLFEETEVVGKVEDRTREGLCFLVVGTLILLSENLPRTAAVPFTIIGIVFILNRYIILELKLLRNYYLSLSILQRCALISSPFIVSSTLILAIGYTGIADKLIALTYATLTIGIINLVYEKRLKISEKDREVISIISIGALSYFIGGLSLWIPTIFAVIGVALILRGEKF